MEGKEATVFRYAYSTEERKKTRIVLLGRRVTGSRQFCKCYQAKLGSLDSFTK